jgi:plasmid stabilization system protein ParE
LKPLRVLDDAEDDIQAAMGWYRRIGPGLSDAFLSRLQETLLLIREHPAMYQLDFDDIRSAPLRRFPYLVYYRDLPEMIQVNGVLHDHLDPARIAERISGRAGDQ